MWHTNLAITYRKLGRYREAIAACQRAITLKPELPEAHNNLCVAYSRMGRHREAIEECQEAIRLKENYAEACYNLGLIYLAAGKKSAALEQHRALKLMDPKLANDLYHRVFKNSLVNARDK